MSRASFSSPHRNRRDEAAQARAETQPLLSQREIAANMPRHSEYSGVRRGRQMADFRRSSFSVSDLTRHFHSSPASHQQPSQQPPLLKQLFGSQFTVSNPYASHDLSSSTVNLAEMQPPDLDSSGELDDTQNRVSILSVLRPEKLIGHWDSLAVWRDSYVEELSKIKNKKVRSFYESQNDLIQRFSAIDHLLDYGKIHLNMLSTYTNPATRRLSDASPEDLETNVDYHATPSRGEASSSAGPDTTPKNVRKFSDEATDMQNSNSKSRIHDLPGNIHEGGQLLGFDEESSSYQVQLAIMVNFFVNFLLMIAKIAISLLTNSLSVIASLVDSVLDFFSTFIIYIANRLSNTKNWRTQIAYPIGRAKLEPLGILIFSVVIIISFFQVGLESFKKLFLNSSANKEPAKIGTDALCIMLVTILAKICCWWWCSLSKSSSVQALAQDAVTDIIFNTVSLLMPTAGHLLNIWWLDPAGALSLSLYVIVSWGRTAFEHIDNLTGAVANAHDYKVVLYLAYRFAECIKQITALKVYHAGDKLNVEIDLVFDTENFDLSFKDAHDIAEALQYAIETLPMVERAFVHIDYMEGNFKGHLN